MSQGHFIFFLALSLVPIEARDRRLCCLSRRRNGDKKEKSKNGRSYLIKKQYYIIIQPNTFDFGKIINKQLIERIIVFAADGTLLLDDDFNCESYLVVKGLLNQHCELITYNGFLLDHLL